jgi:hypothetical protein
MAGALVGAALLVGACGSDDTPPGGGGSGGGAGDGDHDGCLIGTWHLDVQDVADQMVALMSIPGGSAEATGTVTITFGDDLTIVYDDTVVITIPMSSMEMVATAVYSGSATSAEWTAKEGVLHGGQPTGDFDIAMTYRVGGQEVPATIPLPGMGDLGGGDMTYTCAGGSAELKPPSPAPTWRLTKD